MNYLEVNIDPLKEYEGVKPQRLLQATGLLANFAADVAMSEPESVQEAFDMLMECYGYGWGQDGSGWGTVDDKGVYHSEFKEDPPMAPLVQFVLTPDISFYVYQYSICAVTDGETTLIMRMD